MGKRFLLNDINGNSIAENQKFTFILKVLKIANEQKLTGSFSFDEDTLRYVIDIEGDEFYTCLNYNPELMSSFELLKQK
jgi:hypothetical protein